MERRNIHAPTRRLSALAIGILAVTLMSFFVARSIRAAGEPTLTISLSDSNLTAGETATVTFAFSTTPFNFDDTDVDLSDANGALSPVGPTANDRVWTATFTPSPGVNDPSNTITVGTQWNDSGGVSPIGPSTSPNYSVQTGSSGGGGGGCQTSSIRLVSPNGGEVLTAGSSYDVYWSMSGCQATSVQLLLSSDGGATYAVTGESPQPTYGFYRWTVPNAPSASSLMQARLIGSGGTLLASDESDGPFTIESAPTPAPAPSPDPTSPPPTAPAPAPAPAPDPQPAPAPAPAPAPNTPSPATTAPASAPPPAKPAPRFPAPAAPPMPIIPVPLALAATDPSASSTPTDPPMPAIAQNQPTDAAPAALTLENVQGAVETASSFAPSWLETGFSFALGALTMLGLVLGFQKTVQRRKAAAGSLKKPCHTCHGTGTEPDEQKLRPCDECDGTGQVEDENEPSIECPHCKGEGEDPCHVCKGTGKNAAGEECPACKGEGKTLTGKKDEDGEDEVAECEICRGEGEIEATIKRMIPCEKCGGTGKI